MEHYNEDYLLHYGVKGMKWGVRRDKKWAASPYQPSSRRSSNLAVAYLTTGSKRLGKMLDKSNDKDAERWKKAKEKYPEEAKLGQTRIDKMSEVDDKVIRLNKKYERMISDEYKKLEDARQQNKSFDESRLETLETEYDRYNRMGVVITEKMANMSMQELSQLDLRTGKDQVTRYLNYIDKLNAN